MTRRVPYRNLIAALSLLTLSACSEISDDPLPPVGPAAKAHPDGWLTRGTDTFHGEAIRTAGWDMETCKSCHGQDYAGGFVEVSCLTCHADTPESCTTCHGTAGTAVSPPRDLSGSSSTASLGVGAHQIHLSTEITNPLDCTDCHVVPSFADAGHIDGDGRAEITFGERALTNGGTATYDPATGSCANTYCHGGGRFGRGDHTIPWNEVGSGQAECGTCHALPPTEDTGHLGTAVDFSCDLCHSGVVKVDELDPSIIHLIAPETHINGSAELQ
jgi:predicted CxxxxCH...CXXCH cytochrome family protein